MKATPQGIGHVSLSQLQNLQTACLKSEASLYKVLCRIAGPTCATLASKVLKQRPGTVQRAKDVYLTFCELEQADAVVVGS